MPLFTGWQWLDEHSTWHDYDSTVSRKIEALYSAGTGGSIDMEICGRRYEIDVDSMQQANKDTKVTRKIQRCGTSSSSAEATLPTATAAAPSSSSMRSTSASTSNKSKSDRKTKKGLCTVIYNISKTPIAVAIYASSCISV